MKGTLKIVFRVFETTYIHITAPSPRKIQLFLNICYSAARNSIVGHVLSCNAHHL